MTKSELIEVLSRRQAHLKADDVDLAVKTLLEMMSGALTQGERIEIRGFGSFSLHFRPPRLRGPARKVRPAFQARQGVARSRQRQPGHPGRLSFRPGMG
jgi:nucleoid DNA-binding protein